MRKIALILLCCVPFLLMCGCREEVETIVILPAEVATVTTHGVPLDPTATVTCDQTSAPVGGTVNITVALAVPTTETADCPQSVATITLAPGLSPVSATGDKGQITCSWPTVTSNGNPVVVTPIGSLPVVAVTLSIPAPTGNTYTIPLGALVRGGPAATVKIKATVL